MCSWIHALPSKNEMSILLQKCRVSEKCKRGCFLIFNINYCFLSTVNFLEQLLSQAKKTFINHEEKRGQWLLCFRLNFFFLLKRCMGLGAGWATEHKPAVPEALGLASGTTSSSSHFPAPKDMNQVYWFMLYMAKHINFRVLTDIFPQRHLLYV